jgi:hypothetical protein
VRWINTTQASTASAAGIEAGVTGSPSSMVSASDVNSGKPTTTPSATRSYGRR